MHMLLCCLSLRPCLCQMFNSSSQKYFIFIFVPVQWRDQQNKLDWREIISDRNPWRSFRWGSSLSVCTHLYLLLYHCKGILSVVAASESFWTDKTWFLWLRLELGSGGGWSSCPTDFLCSSWVLFLFRSFYFIPYFKAEHRCDKATQCSSVSKSQSNQWLRD